jgi:hypothetical protein
MVRPGYGSAGSGSPLGLSSIAAASPQNVSTAGPVLAGTSSPYGGGFDGTAAVGYRPIRWVSFGLSGGYRSSSASSVTGLSGLGRSAMSAGLYARGYGPTFVGLEPYVGVGISYVHDDQSYAQSVQGTTLNMDLTHYGFAVPITVGVDYRLLRYFAVGPSFEYERVFAAGGCSGGTAPDLPAGYAVASYCANGNPALVSADAYGAWSLGLDVRVTLF